MANFVYDLAAQSLWSGEIDFGTDAVKCVLVDTDSYIVSRAGDQFLADIPVLAQVSTSADLANKTIVGRIIDADDVVFTAVAGAESEALVIFQDTGDINTSRLICYIDTGTGLPVTPNGADLTIKWHASGIATL